MKMKNWYTYKMEFSSTRNKNGVNFFARKWIGILHYNIKEDGSSFREKRTACSCSCAESSQSYR